MVKAAYRPTAEALYLPSIRGCHLELSHPSPDRVLSLDFGAYGVRVLSPASPTKKPTQLCASDQCPRESPLD